MTSGIYKITNLTNDHHYVGGAVNLAKRWREHQSRLRHNVHCNPHLQSSWDKYGEASFEFKIIGTCASEDLISLEQEVMDHLKPEYNISPTAGSRLGLKHSPESCAKMSASHSGLKPSPDTISKMSISHKGLERSPEHCANISAAKRGQKYSPEACANISKAHQGKTASIETRAKISAANKGRKFSPEHRANMSTAAKASWAKRKK